MAGVRESAPSPPHRPALPAARRPTTTGGPSTARPAGHSNAPPIPHRLEERGLVTRTPAPHDRRVRLLVLTKKGHALRKEISERLAEAPPPIAGLSLDDQRTLRDILARAVDQTEAES